MSQFEDEIAAASQGRDRASRGRAGNAQRFIGAIGFFS